MEASTPTLPRELERSRDEAIIDRLEERLAERDAELHATRALAESLATSKSGAPYWQYRVAELQAKVARLERENDQLARNAAMIVTDLEIERSRNRSVT